MNKQQEARLNSFYATQSVLHDNATTWNGIPAIVAVVTEYDNNISTIEDAVEVQVKDLKGHTQAKADALETMITKTLQVAGATMAWAEANKNAGLAEEMNIVPSELRNYRDAIVAQRCQGVYAAANTNIAALSNFGILPADLVDLQAKITTYVSLVSRPRTLVTARSVKTAGLGFLIRDTTRLLDRRLDMLMRGFTVTKPDFYNQYLKARNIVDPSTQSEPKPQQKVA